MELVVQLVIMIFAAAACAASGNLQTACVLLAVCIVFLFLAAAYFRYRRERELKEIILYLMHLQDGLRLPELKRCKEGQLAVLESEIYKLVVLISRQSDRARKEKEYLAEMLSDISHQIKTPLSSITIMTELLRSEGISEEKREEITGKIDSQVRRITWLVRNLLTLSQLDADMLKLKREEVPVRRLLEEACQPFAIMAELKGISLTVSAPEDLHLVCDERWTAEAVSNIVKNCIEHTPAGGEVWIGAGQNNFATTITVRDNGSGIPAEDLPHIFERFYKGTGAKKDSVGIGLAMSRQIILRQNGTIHVESGERKGSCFRIKLYSDVVV